MSRPRPSGPEKRSQSLKLEALEQRLAPAGLNLPEQVADLYRLGLHRAPTPAAVNSYVAQLQQGAPLANVARSIIDSPEYHRNFVTGVFRNHLDREPTPRELSRFTRALNTGTSEEKVLARLFSTASNLTNRQYVTFLYDKILNREPDSAAMSLQLLKLAAGTSRYAAALSLIESREFAAKITTELFRHIYESEPDARELASGTRRLTRADYGFRDAFVSAVSSARGQQVVSQKSNALMALPPDSASALFGVAATMYPGAAVDTSAAVTELVNQIRAVETFSNPTNMGQIIAGLRPNDFPDPNAKNDDKVPTTGTYGLDAYPGDGRNTPGAFQVDLANLHQKFGLWAGQAGSLKNSGPYDTQIAFSKATLARYLGIEVDANGFITQIGKVAASVFLRNEAVALDDSFDPLRNPLINLHIDNFQGEQLSLYLAGRSAEDSSLTMANDTRVAPQALLDMDAELQGAAARGFIWHTFNDLYLRSGTQFNPTYLKAAQLFGSTMRITGSTSAFGVEAGTPFLCQFNPGFIIGGGYVRGFSVNGVFDIIQAVVEADENGQATFTAQDAQGTLGPLEITQSAGSASGVAVTGNDTAYIGFPSGQTTETYRVSVGTPGSYGTAKLNVSSDSGTDTPTDQITPVAGIPIKIGSRGLTLTFDGGSFTAGASWTARVTQVSPTKTITISKSVERGVKVFSVDRTPINVSTEYPSIFHYGAIMSLYPVDMGAGDWDVDQTAYDHGYSNHQVAVNVTDTTTAPTGQGSYGVIYRDLGLGKTLTLTGSDNYHVAPFVQRDPSQIVIRVDSAGYNTSDRNHEQTVAVGNKIDMSDFGTTMANAYPNFFYVFTQSGVDVVKHVSDPAVPADSALRMYYIPAANGSVATAQTAVTNGDFSATSPYRSSYRVLLANKAVLGTPTSAAVWGTNFIMTPPPPPPIGTGTIDASRATGPLFLKADNSIAEVRLGSGSNTVVGIPVNTPVTYVLNPAMDSGVVARSSFSGLRYGTDQISLREFTNVANLRVTIGPSFDNRSDSTAIQDFYDRYSSTAVVSFDSDVSGSRRTYTFLVLLNGPVERTSAQWQAMVTSSIRSS